MRGRYRFGVCGACSGGVVVELGLAFSTPRPVTVTRSTTLRLPAKDCAMRFAVCFSLPVATEPESSMVSPVTLTSTLDPASVGSALIAVSILGCRSVSAEPVIAPVVLLPVAEVVPAAPMVEVPDCGMVRVELLGVVLGAVDIVAPVVLDVCPALGEAVVVPAAAGVPLVCVLAEVVGDALGEALVEVLADVLGVVAAPLTPPVVLAPALTLGAVVVVVVVLAEGVALGAGLALTLGAVLELTLGAVADCVPVAAVVFPTIEPAVFCE